MLAEDEGQVLKNWTEEEQESSLLISVAQKTGVRDKDNKEWIITANG